MRTCSINGKTVSIFSGNKSGSPVIYLNTVSDEGRQVYEAAQVAGCPPFNFGGHQQPLIGTTTWPRGTVQRHSKGGALFRAVPVKQEKLKVPIFGRVRRDFGHAVSLLHQ